jgi:aminoglycoside phosphotransferase (APT) family kinase protein
VPGAQPIESAEKIQGGQSNPTYILHAGDKRYVLRRKPGGVLLKSAHAVEREYRVQARLRARMCLCREDACALRGPR